MSSSPTATGLVGSAPARRAAGPRPGAPAACLGTRVALVLTGALVASALVAAVLLIVPPAAGAARVGEWRHAWEVVRLMRERPPRGTPVFYFGDSTARESTVRDVLWTRQLRRRAAAADRTTATVAFTMAGHGQTFRMDRQLVAAMPARQPGAPAGIALIGVGLSRFIGPPVRQRPAAVQPPPDGQPPVVHSWTQHLYADRPPLPLARKRELVPRWMERRWAGFRRWRQDNLRAVGKLLELCRQRGFRPVLVELPLDVRVVKDGLERPRRSYRRGVRKLAARYGADHLSLQGPAPLPTASYWDLMHLLPPGTRVWQSRLSDAVVGMLPPADGVGLGAATVAAARRR